MLRLRKAAAAQLQPGLRTLGKRFWAVYGLDRAELIREYNERYEAETGRIAA